MLNRHEWKGCAKEVKACNDVERKRNGIKLRMHNKKEKLLAVRYAQQRLDTMTRRLTKELDTLRKADQDVAMKYKRAFDRLRTAAGKVRRKVRQSEINKIIKKLNL